MMSAMSVLGTMGCGVGSGPVAVISGLSMIRAQRHSGMPAIAANPRAPGRSASRRAALAAFLGTGTIGPYERVPPWRSNMDARLKPASPGGGEGPPGLTSPCDRGAIARPTGRAGWWPRPYSLSTDLIWPLFLVDGSKTRAAVPSMPGVERLSSTRRCARPSARPS